MFLRIAGSSIGLIIAAGFGVRSVDLSGASAPEVPTVTYPPVSTGRLWLNTDYSAQDWGRDSLFLDVMRTARAWRAQTSTQFNDAGKLAEMMATADADGYPTVLPSDTAAGTIVMLEQGAASAPALGGRYRLEYQGAGTLLLTGVSNQATGAGFVEFDFTPTDSNSIDIRITATASGNHLRGLKCYLVAHAALVAAGQVVHPAFKAAYPNIKTLRFMMAQDTNKNTQTTWATAPQPSSIGLGVSWMEMVKVCNELGCHGWFHFPYAATSDYVTQAATVLRDNLNPALKAYLEYANEPWNSSYGFDTYHYLDALRSGKTYNVYEQWGGRSTECMQAASAVFAGQMNRIVRVMGVQTDWIGLETNNLYAPGWVAEQVGRVVPHTVHDAIAVTGYFNNPADQWPTVIVAAQSNYATGRSLLVSNIEANIEQHRTSRFPHFKGVANALGKQLLMYEGGSHLFDIGGTTNTPLVQQLVAEVNRGELAVGLYGKMMAAWDEFSSVPGGFNQFSSTRREEATGEFGALQYINQTTPRHTAIMAYNAGTFPVVESGITPRPLTSRLLIAGHSIPDEVAREPWDSFFSAMGVAAQSWTATGPSASDRNRWENPVATGTPDNIKALLEAPGASYDIFIGTEAIGDHAAAAPRRSVQAYLQDYIPSDGVPADGPLYGTYWHNLAAASGAQTYKLNFWRNDPAQVFGADWRASLEQEKLLWTTLVNEINAARAPGTPSMLVIPLLEVWCAVWDALQAGTLVGMPPWFVPTGQVDQNGLIVGAAAGMYKDDVHIQHPAGRWIQMVTMVAVAFRLHPDTMPANGGPNAFVSEALAAQLRPLVWSTCVSDQRTGLA